MVNRGSATVDFQIYGSRKRRRGAAFWLVCHRCHGLSLNSSRRSQENSPHELKKNYGNRGNDLKSGSTPCFALPR